MADPRILFVAPKLPYPLTSGTALRHFHLIRAYASAGRVDLVFFGRTSEPADAGAALKPFCDSIHRVPEPTLPSLLAGESPLWRRRLQQLTRRTPSNSWRFTSDEMRETVEALVPSARLVHVAKLWMVPNADRAVRGRSPGTSAVLDLDDVETVFKRRALLIRPPGSWQRRLLEEVDLLRLSRYQRRALAVFDRVLVCSARDKEELRHARVEVVPNGTSVRETPLPDESDGRTLLCVGTLGYWPNVDGLLLFVERALPLIREQVPDVRLLIVGSAAPDAVRALHDGKRVFVHSDVPEVEPYYRQATASVVCLRVGSGTRLRVLEAFGLGRAVVSTSVGCEGLDVTHGRHLLIADDPAELARACVAVLKDQRLRDRLVAGARLLSKNTYAWELVESRARALAEALLTDTRQPA